MDCIGGSVLAALQASKHPAIQNASLAVLVRGKDKASVMEAKGLETVLFENFDDSETIVKAASEHDSMSNAHLSLLINEHTDEKPKSRHPHSFRVSH